MIFLQTLRHLFFPDYCMQCNFPIENQRTFFCKGCLKLLELIDLQFRCHYCFQSLENGDHDSGICEKQIHRFASAMEYEGPAGTLLRAIKYGVRQDLAKVAAAHMVLQWEKLNWPHPDLLIPVPSSEFSVEILAKEFGEFLSVRVENLLSRERFSVAQHHLSQEKREKISPNSFSIKKPEKISGKIIYLIDDVLTTGGTLRACARTIEAHYPFRIFALTFCSS